MAISSDDFKTLLGSWATGVTIVTSRTGEKIHGMTVAAFTEVSLSPPLVLVCADKSSNTHPVIAESGVFAVNILAAEGEDPAVGNHTVDRMIEPPGGFAWDFGAVRTNPDTGVAEVLAPAFAQRDDEGRIVLYFDRDMTGWQILSPSGGVATERGNFTRDRKGLPLRSKLSPPL